MNLRVGVLCLLLAGTPMQSNADMVSKDGAGNTITLHEEPCVISPWMKEWRTATFFYQGTQYAACWRLQGQTVVIMDSEGDVTPVPMQAFRPSTSV